MSRRALSVTGAGSSTTEKVESRRGANFSDPAQDSEGKILQAGMLEALDSALAALAYELQVDTQNEHQQVLAVVAPQAQVRLGRPVTENSQMHCSSCHCNLLQLEGLWLAPG